MQRHEQLEKLNQVFDVLVIGGGATGLGVALDSAARGYSTLLLEARDFAQGTSSRSTKLVHGGVRYLEQGDVKLVYEALHERGRLMHNAPHLVHELRFLVPAYKWWQLPYYSAGLVTYDLLSGRLRLSRSSIVTSAGAMKAVPTIEPEGLMGGVIYSDSQFNDTRLAMIIARTAVKHGATLINDMSVRELIKSRGRLIGVVAEDAESRERHEIRARAIINATGVFTDQVRRLDEPTSDKMIAPSQGIHLVLDRRFLPADTGILVPKTEDGRVIFILPWQGRTLVGTTDTEVPEPSMEPTAHEDEIDFVLRHAARYLTREPTREDILSVFAGLRPLVRPANGSDSTAALSRDFTLIESPSGLVTITGGKWTTYRAMAEDAVDHAAGVAGLPKQPSITENLQLVGHDSQIPRWQEFGASEAEVRQYESEYPGDLHPRLPYNMAMVAYVVDKEMPVKLEDVLSRRLRALILDARAAIEAAPKTADLMARLQNRDEAWARQQVDAFQDLATNHYLVSE